MKVGNRGVTREALGSQRVEVVEVIGSFLVVKSTTGAKFTVHEFEFWPDGDCHGCGPIGAAHMDGFHNWPHYNLHLAVVGEGSGRRKSLMVTGTDKAPPVRGQATIFSGVRAVRG